MSNFFLDIIDDDGAAVESVEVTQVKQEPVTAPIESATHLLIKPEAWGWEQLRDYVLTEIQKYHGKQVRNPVKEKAIFQAFSDRWGDKAAAIARYAFEISQGVWHRAPITMYRFCKGSDEFFAQVIADQLGL